MKYTIENCVDCPPLTIGLHLNVTSQQTHCKLKTSSTEMDSMHFPYRTSSLNPVYLQCAHSQPVETSARWLDPSPGLHAGNSSHFCSVWSVAQCFFDPILCTEFFQFASLEWIGIEWLYYQQCNDFSVGEPITDPELDKTPPLVTAAKETIWASIQSRSRSDSLQPALSWVMTHF